MYTSRVAWAVFTTEWIDSIARLLTQLGLPKGYSDGVTLFNTLRKRMGLREISDFREHVQLDKISDLREAYARGEVFNEGDIVFGKLNEEIRIKERKPNFIVDSKGNKHWITDLSEKKKPIKRAYKGVEN